MAMAPFITVPRTCDSCSAARCSPSRRRTAAVASVSAALACITRGDSGRFLDESPCFASRGVAMGWYGRVSGRESMFCNTGCCDGVIRGFLTRVHILHHGVGDSGGFLDESPYFASRGVAMGSPGAPSAGQRAVVQSTTGRGVRVVLWAERQRERRGQKAALLSCPLPALSQKILAERGIKQSTAVICSAQKSGLLTSVWAKWQPERRVQAALLSSLVSCSPLTEDTKHSRVLRAILWQCP